MVSKIFQVFIVLFITAIPSGAQHFIFKRIDTNINSSFRGLSVVDNKVAWASGSAGWVGRTSNGGKSWRFLQVTGYENIGFRSIYAFDNKNVVIANAGSPAKILITDNGGSTWTVAYVNEHPDAFFDGIDFWNAKEGIIYGDGIDGKMLLLTTKDGGKNWDLVKDAPNLNEGEASFAASGTGIRCIGTSKVIIATGGLTSRLWVSTDKGATWNTVSPPIVQGEKTTGIYSVGVNETNLNLVGGDYTNPSMSSNHNLYSVDSGESWKIPDETTRGYRECVEFIDESTWMATGPTGTDISADNGKNWSPLSDEEGFHVLRKARNGSLIIAAGAAGQISIIKKAKP